MADSKQPLAQFLDNLNSEQLVDRLNLALDGASLGIWDWDLRDNSVQFDRRWCEMLGLAHEEISMQLSTWEERVHPDDIAGCYEDIQRYLKGETEFYENIHRMRHADGRWVYILDRGRVSGWDEQGEAIRFTGTHFDCTATERAKEVLAGQQRLLEDMVRNLPTAVAMLDRDYGYLATTREWTELCPDGVGPLEGTTIREREPALPGGWYAACDAALLGQATHIDEEAVIVAGRTRHYRWSVRPWHANDEVIGGVICMMEDITRAVEERQARESAARLSSLGLMAGGVAHEINTPLQTIRLSSDLMGELLAQEEPPLDVMRDCNDSIQETTLHIARVVKALRTISRDATDDPVRAESLYPVVDDVLELSSSRLRAAEIELEWTPAEDGGPMVQARPAEVAQIILNLLNNAFDAVEEATEPKVQLEVSTDEGFAVLRVLDNGHGVAPEQVGKLMTPFFTTKPVGKGTGLGLSVSRAFAERMGGTLQFVPGELTIFELRLPLAAAGSTAR